VSALLFRGNQAIEALSSHDRGLMYGDGLFETLRASQGDMPWWSAHWQRLSYGASRLGIVLPEQSIIREAALSLLGNEPAVLKIILTRGESGRGYLPGKGPATCIVSVHPLPAPHPRPLALHCCETRIAEQAALAGIKHLNRLENVLARAECEAAGFAEGVMRNNAGHVICATAGNVFMYSNGVWRTPDVAHGGIAGIARQWFLTQLPDVHIEDISYEQLEQAEAVFLCNAVRGMMAVERIGQRPIPTNAALSALELRFLAANPFFEES
jgi:4-amino-4-deoxychorismate lyase